jgi:DNA-directed RNA polymerase alpha subunit
MEAALFPLGRNPANIMISEISIGNRALNVFRKYGIQTVADLILNEPNDLTDLRGFGPGCLAETITALREIGFELKPIDYAARR